MKAFGGTTGVLLAFNVPEKTRKGLLGFAVERETLDGPNLGKTKWLAGMLNFPGLPHEAGQPVPSNVAPIQKFRWSDYTVFPGTRYRYSMHPVYGPAGNVTLTDGPQVEVATQGESFKHYVIFNRAAAASQAFAREFPQVVIDLSLRAKNKLPLSEYVLPPPVLEWLSRRLLERLLSFLDQAVDSTWALDICIYEYELLAIREAVARAAKRGVKVRILYHANPTDEQTAINRDSLKKPALPKSKVVQIGRVTHSIMHDKFVILSRLSGSKRTANAVLCGSTNFTENGIYRQANVIHVAQDAGIAKKYLEQFELLVDTADDPGATRTAVTQTNPIDATTIAFSGFSPRSGGGDLKEMVRTIGGARQDVLFCTVFKPFSDIEAALLGNPGDNILRFGLQNTRTSITGTHKDRTANFVAAAYLQDGLEGWLKESTAGQRGNILIHTKLVVVDFTSKTPSVISGSHNLSKAASDKNDENFLIFRCKKNETDVADAYGIELMRLYDHYRFRWYVQGRSASGKPPPAPVLDVTDGWTKGYFSGGNLKTADRLRFSAA